MEWGAWFFGPEDEVKLKTFKAMFGIKNDEKAKELYIEVKNAVKSIKD